PKITKAMMRTTISSSGPTFGISPDGTDVRASAPKAGRAAPSLSDRSASAGYTLPRMILSDRTIREELKGGGIVIEPLTDDAIQPSSVDLHVDRYFRVFRNDTTPYIDPKEPQDDLTEFVEVSDGGAFILHPGEFVLGSTLERVALPDDLVARLAGKSSLGRVRLPIHSSLPGSEVVWTVVDGVFAPRRISDVVAKRERSFV